MASQLIVQTALRRPKRGLRSEYNKPRAGSIRERRHPPLGEIISEAFRVGTTTLPAKSTVIE
jgi:hypothetical protein